MKIPRTAANFSAAAQSHANATWFYLIAAGLVWFFTSWGWALIPLTLGIFTTIQSVSATRYATKLTRVEAELDRLDAALQVISKFGEVLAEGIGDKLLVYRSDAELHHSKDDIINAVCYLQAALEAPDQLRPILSGMYPPDAVEHVLSPAFANALECNLALLDNFVPDEVAKKKQKVWAETMRIAAEMAPPVP